MTAHRRNSRKRKVFLTRMNCPTLVGKPARGKRAPPPAAAHPPAAPATDEVHEGKVVAVGENTITILDRRDNDQDTFVVTAAT
jgi:hypothetical protein